MSPYEGILGLVGRLAPKNRRAPPAADDDVVRPSGRLAEMRREPSSHSAACGAQRASSCSLPGSSGARPVVDGQRAEKAF